MHALNDNNEWNESDKNYWNVNKNPTGYYRNNFSKGNSNYDDVRAFSLLIKFANHRFFA